MARVKIDYFFNDPNRFPWGIFGIDYPGAGPLLCYIGRAALLVCDQREVSMLRSPTYFELERFSQIDYAVTVQSIYTFMTAVGDPCTTQGKAEALLEWLRLNSKFRKMFQQQLDSMYLNKVILLPEVALERYP
jgi:hypothetical protein